MIRVGQTWKSRDGGLHTIIKEETYSGWPFRSEHHSWTKEGYFQGRYKEYRLDLITLVKDVEAEKAAVSVDWTKPIQTRDGLGKAELIAVLNDPRFNHVVKITREGNHDCIQLVTVEGKLGNEREQAHMNIINVPPPPPKVHKTWVNFRKDGTVVAHTTKDSADSYADSRLGCVEVSFTEEVAS